MLREYLQRELAKKQEIVAQLKENESERTNKRLLELLLECGRIGEVLSFLSA